MKTFIHQRDLNSCEITCEEGSRHIGSVFKVIKPNCDWLEIRFKIVTRPISFVVNILELITNKKVNQTIASNSIYLDEHLRKDIFQNCGNLALEASLRPNA